MPKRLIRKLDLEIRLSQLHPHPSPSPRLEQYTISADVAATMLYIAAYTFNDIVNKEVLDLGCGTGRLALGAVLLGAEYVVGVDIDQRSVEVAHENSVRIGLKNRVQWITADIEVVSGEFDTVLQNPPFGVQRRRADRRFLKKALETGDVVYSLHKSGQSNRLFIERFIERHGGSVTSVSRLRMNIPRIFPFHTKRKHMVYADLYRIESN